MTMDKKTTQALETLSRLNGQTMTIRSLEEHLRSLFGNEWDYTTGDYGDLDMIYSFEQVKSPNPLVGGDNLWEVYFSVIGEPVNGDERHDDNTIQIEDVCIWDD